MLLVAPFPEVPLDAIPIRLLALVACCCLTLTAPTRAADAARPNVLVLLADDLRPDALGALGNRDARTPHLDRFAAQGMVFNRAHIMGGLEGAVCIPSRAMMLCGRSLFTVDRQLKNTPTWPIRLREAGYTTHFSGKWHNGPASAGANFPGAKSVFLGGMSDQFRVQVQDFAADGKPGPRRLGGKHSSELFADEAVRFLEKPPAGPWALYVAFTAPHDPREAPPEWHGRFAPDKMTLPPNFLPEHPFDNGELKIRDEKLADWPRTPATIRKHLADYHAILAHLDAQVGRILAALDKVGQAERTVVVFAGDNGLALGSHGLLGKQNVYEHSVGVPLLVRGPGVRAGARSEALCYLLDLGPTLCELAGATVLEGAVGRSLVPVLRGERTDHRDALLFAYRHFQRSVRDGRWKAIWYPQLDRWQLFDLEKDPHETRDLAGAADQRDRLAGLKAKLADLRREFGDAADLRGKP